MNVSPVSTSVVLRVPITVLAATFSLTLVALNVMSVGASLTLLTLMVNALV